MRIFGSVGLFRHALGRLVVVGFFYSDRWSNFEMGITRVVFDQVDALISGELLFVVSGITSEQVFSYEPQTAAADEICPVCEEMNGFKMVESSLAATEELFPFFRGIASFCREFGMAEWRLMTGNLVWVPPKVCPCGRLRRPGEGSRWGLGPNGPFSRLRAVQRRKPDFLPIFSGLGISP